MSGIRWGLADAAGARRNAEAAGQIARIVPVSLSLLPSFFYDSFSMMSTVTVILEPDADGTVHLPVPPELRHGKLRVVASLQAIAEISKPDLAIIRASLKATPEMMAKRKAALESLRAAGGLRDFISDPSAWQREIRQDRPLPGRE